jgi:hypothetical protein
MYPYVMNSELFESIETAIINDENELFAEYAKAHPKDPPIIGLHIALSSYKAVRLVGWPMQYWLTMGPHYRPDKPDINRWGNLPLPPGGYKLYPSEGISFAESHVSLRFKIFALDRHDNKIKILDFPVNAFRPIVHFSSKLGPPSAHGGYDLLIRVNTDCGISVATSGAKTPLTSIEEGKISTHPFYTSLEGLCSQHTPEEIAAIKASAHVTHPPDPKAELDQITELLYDISKHPNDHGLNGIRTGLLGRYKALTGKNKPGFFV